MSLAAAQDACGLLLPELGSAEPVMIAPAPGRPEHERGWLSSLLPGLSALGMLGFALVSPNLLIVALAGSAAVLSAGAAVWGARRSRRRQLQAWVARRERYRAHLSRSEVVLTESAARQLAYGLAVHPPPEAWRLPAGGAQPWIRRDSREYVLEVRLGLGRVAARRPARLQQLSEGDPDGDPPLLAEAAALVARFGVVDEMPIAVTLAPGGAVLIDGDRMPLWRATILNLARRYGPTALRIHALCPEAEATWIGQLPHAGCVTTRSADLLSVIDESLRRHDPSSGLSYATQLVVVAAEPSQVRQVLQSALPADRVDAHPFCVLAMSWPGVLPPGHAHQVIQGGAEGGVILERGGDEPRAAITRPDTLAHHAAVLAAAELGRVVESKVATADRPVMLAELLGGARHPLIIPIGREYIADRGGSGAVVELDLREAARGGDGPHGLVCGATGTGKSELLRTILVAAAAQSPPDELAFVLVDYKGGAAFDELGRLPHTAGLLTNLGADPHAVDRCCAALRAELRRRQEAFRSAGVDDIDGYRSRADRDLPPMPRLLVVVDEYAELIESWPDALDTLTSLGRLGRSLGIHLLLSSQRLDDGRLRGLDAHLRYRLCLRTFSAGESIAVIGSAAAARLPAAPGYALASQDGVLTGLRIALVGDVRATVDALLERDRAAAGAHSRSPVRPIFLPALPELIALDQLSPTGDALHSPGSVSGTAAVGLTDLPELGLQAPLIVDLTGPGGHLAVAGAPRSGRSTALATAVAALSLTTSSRELEVHVLAPPASPLARLGGLPHVGTVATTPELQARTVLAIFQTVTDRRQRGAVDGPHILLVIDGLAEVVGPDDQLMTGLASVAAAGLSVGVSLAVSCSRWSELRGGLREAFGTRWELRLNDPTDSMHPQLARHSQRVCAGRVLTASGTRAQLALPRLQSIAAMEPGNDSLEELVGAVARRGGPPTRPIQLLPTLVSAAKLPPPSRAGRVPIGVAGTYAEPVEVPLGSGEHLLVLGNGGSGRTGLLRAVCAAEAGRGRNLWIMDPRRRLAALGGSCRRYAGSPADVAAAVAELVAELTPGGGRHLLVVDDLDLAGGRGGAPSCFGPLADLVPFAGDLGLSIVAARRVSGTNRAAFDPFFAELLEGCRTAVLLSGDPAEGPVLGGFRPRPRRPGLGELILGGETAGLIQVGWLGPDDVSGKNDVIRLTNPANHCEP